MRTILKASFAYFAIVFAVGFVLGALRVLITAPLLGDPWATIVELPVMLAGSWLVCNRVIAHWRIPPAAPVRLVLGGLAFAFLIGAEIALGVTAFGRRLEQVLSSYRQTGPLLGLLAQMLFGLFPRIQSKLHPPSSCSP